MARARARPSSGVRRPPSADRAEEKPAGNGRRGEPGGVGRNPAPVPTGAGRPRPAPVPAAAAAVTVDRLCDDAWSVDCAIRLRQRARAAASADRLLADLARYGHQIEARWGHLEPDVARSLANEVLTVQLAALPAADTLSGETTLPAADLCDRVERLIHREVMAVGDTAWALD